ncbi:MAG: GTP 3',8-cyclase MoaA [Candidatus Methanomethylicaceae archaeon]|nr:GTP 3',8-cyclase MoaA [Candidatus Verstraetearchaeota archaeon]
MIDPFNREITGLRISLTQKCNFNCKYCHHEGEFQVNREMTCEEILRIVKIAHELGIKRVKYTGGEPLLREDLIEIIKGSIEIGLEDVAITTNGSLLKGKSKSLFMAGLRRINVSIPSLNPKIYSNITGGNLFDTINGIMDAVENGLKIKINVVLMKGINENDLFKFINFASSIGGSLQLIELEKLNISDEFFKEYYISISSIEPILKNLAEEIIIRENMNARRIYIINGIKIEVVSPTNKEFCMNCSRIRITSDGKIKPCLMRWNNHVDILGPMRMGASDDELKKIFIKAISLRAPFYK